MINILFYVALVVVAYLLARLFCFISSVLDTIIFKLRLEEKTLSNDNWFLKYELYRKGLENDRKFK